MYILNCPKFFVSNLLMTNGGSVVRRRKVSDFARLLKNIDLRKNYGNLKKTIKI